MRASKSGLFLFELIMVILLFTVSSAVCISIFAKSYSFSIDSENLTLASLKAETVAEAFKNGRGDAGEDIEAIVDAAEANNDTHDVILSEGENSYGEFILNLYYNEQWNITDEVNKVYTLTIKAAGDKKYGKSGIINADIKATEGEKTIFQINAYKNSGN